MKTLSEQMDFEREKKKRQQHSEAIEEVTPVTTSRFFANPSTYKRKRDEEIDGELVNVTPRNPRRIRSGPANTLAAGGKENEMPPLDPVTQEDGYCSPAGSSVVDVSSPIERLSIADNVDVRPSRPQTQTHRRRGSCHADDVSSPATGLTPRRLSWHLGDKGAYASTRDSPTKDTTSGDQPAAILVHSTPSPAKHKQPIPPPCGVDLRDGFEQDDEVEDDPDSSQEIVGPDTPRDLGQLPHQLGTTSRPQEDGGGDWDDNRVDFEVDLDVEIEDIAESNAHRIMLGWRKQWSHNSAEPSRLQSAIPVSAFLNGPGAPSVALPYTASSLADSSTNTQCGRYLWHTLTTGTAFSVHYPT